MEYGDRRYFCRGGRTHTNSKYLLSTGRYPASTYGASQPLKTSGKDHGGRQDTPNQGCGGGDAEMFNPRLNNNLRHYGVCMYVCMWQ